MNIKTNLYVKSEAIARDKLALLEPGKFYCVYFFFDEKGRNGLDIAMPKVRAEDGNFINILFKFDSINLNGNPWELWRKNKKNQLTRIKR